MVATYRIPHYWYHGYCVYTSSPVGGEMRGFGHPQAVFARETHMDEVADAIGMDPLEFRRRNSLHAGDLIDTDVIPNVPLMSIGAEQCLRAGAEAIGWSGWQRHQTKSGVIRRGIGVRFSQEHSGRNASNGLVWMDASGTIHVPIGSGNLGTNAHTGIALIVANALDVPVEDLDCTWGDSATCAWDFVSDASRAVHCHGKAMYNAAIDLRRQLDARRTGRNGPRTDFTPYFDAKTDINPYLDENTGQVVKNPPARLHEQTEALARTIVAEGGLVGLGFYVWNPSAESWGASFAEVEVDMETGRVSVRAANRERLPCRILHSEQAFTFPAEFPFGRAMLLTVHPITIQGNSDHRVDVFEMNSGRRRTLITNGILAEYVDTGHLVYVAGQTLQAVRFDPERLNTIGDPVALDVGAPIAGFAVSRNGTLTYVPGTAAEDIAVDASRSLVWVDRRGKETPTNAPHVRMGVCVCHLTEKRPSSTFATRPVTSGPGISGGKHFRV